jgi:hypothetical protein
MMTIREFFDRDITRPINGVVKADQQDDASVWHELDEFVVTRELDKHLHLFISNYLAVADNLNKPEYAGKIGVWISGFFGSGKSHYLKVLSYLMGNRTLKYDGQTKRTADFFETKIKDPMFYADIKRAVAFPTDVVLFNIETKSDHANSRDAILSVLLRMLNELQGYAGHPPHIAHMERHLDERGKLATFHEAFLAATGKTWHAERDAFDFYRDEMIGALSKALGQSVEASTNWYEKAEANFSLTVENFCLWVKEYLDSKGPDHRLLFFADEVGAFIGQNSQLMLNLQTITETLGTTCGGRAWIIVTSQEDIDTVIGEMSRSRVNDFSRITARFTTRMSLSSANVDEVIRARLLAKRDVATTFLEALYTEKGDIIRNQLTFGATKMSMKSYVDAADFAATYPFIPYQFQLLQKIFEAIRKAGATGIFARRVPVRCHPDQRLRSRRARPALPLLSIHREFPRYCRQADHRTGSHQWRARRIRRSYSRSSFPHPLRGRGEGQYRQPRRSLHGGDRLRPPRLASENRSQPAATGKSEPREPEWRRLLVLHQ